MNSEFAIGLSYVVNAASQQSDFWVITDNLEKLLRPKCGSHLSLLSLSSGPHATWNDGTWAVRSCLPDLGHKQITEQTK